MQTLDQGTVIYGIRSEKYPEVRCYGIIVSARCDVANCKVRRLYYVIGVDVNDWIVTEEGFSHVLDSKLKEVERKIYEAVRKAGLDPDTLLCFDEESVKKVLAVETDAQTAETILRLHYDYSEYFTKDLKKRRELIKANLKSVRAQLKEINKGKQVHLYYLPQAAYMDTKEMLKGLIIDLQELEAIPIADADALEKGLIDRKLRGFGKLEYYNRFCWLDKDDDFTAIDCQIKSPWCEHLMQRFSNSFIRIGLDGPSDKDFDKMFADDKEKNL